MRNYGIFLVERKKKKKKKKPPNTQKQGKKKARKKSQNLERDSLASRTWEECNETNGGGKSVGIGQRKKEGVLLLEEQQKALGAREEGLTKARGTAHSSIR